MHSLYCVLLHCFCFYFVVLYYIVLSISNSSLLNPCASRKQNVIIYMINLKCTVHWFWWNIVPCFVVIYFHFPYFVHRVDSLCQIICILYKKKKLYHFCVHYRYFIYVCVRVTLVHVCSRFKWHHISVDVHKLFLLRLTGAVRGQCQWIHNVFPEEHGGWLRAVPENVAGLGAALNCGFFQSHNSKLKHGFKHDSRHWWHW